MVAMAEAKKFHHVKFWRHFKLLAWKSYVQRWRRWQIVAAQAVFAGLLFLLAVYAANPVFLTPLQAKPSAVLTYDDIMMTLSPNTQLGYAPYTDPYKTIMEKVAKKLDKVFITGSSEQELNDELYTKSRGQVLRHHVIWVIWKTKLQNVWRFSIRSTELAELTTTEVNATVTQSPHNRHLRVGFLAVQLAVSESLLETDSTQPLRHKIKLKAMPISPLMQKEVVRQAMVWILLCFTLAFIPPVMEVSELVVHETTNGYKMNLDKTKVMINEHVDSGQVFIIGVCLEVISEYIYLGQLLQLEGSRPTGHGLLFCFSVAFIPPVMGVSELVVHATTNDYKRGLCMRNVGAACIYLGWLTYLLITALPILILATLALILIFRWVWLFVAFVFLTIYVTVMTMTAFIVCMFQRKSHIAAIWSALFTLLQLFLADLLVHHGFDGTTSFTILLHILLPPLGLVHGFNGFALLQTGREGLQNTYVYEHHTLIIWVLMIFIYFLVLMMLQRTIGNDRAIGGQVSWRSIIFKQAEDQNKVQVIHNPIGNERDKLQEVDELHAKAISFNSVSKSIMGVPLLRGVTLDIYRGEYTQLFAERIQDRMLKGMEDLITGLTLPDEGSVNILGHDMATLSKAGKKIMTLPGMLGYCHRPGFLIDELSVEETLQFFIQMYLWDKGDTEAESYMLIHEPKLLEDCDLKDERNTYVRNLGTYYKAQLCWAIAMILEPRIVFIEPYVDGQQYVSVVNDKIVKYRKHLTIVKMSFSTTLLEHADRVFLFDRKILVFGGTPAYMFFKYGREYRVRMTFRARGSLDSQRVEELIDRAFDMGGQVRAYFGTLLILRLPTSPTDRIAAFVKEITEHSEQYGITSLNISLPDSDEIFKRAINESRRLINTTLTNEVTLSALRDLSKPKQWKREKSLCLNSTLLKQSLWKYVSFYIHYRLFLIITLLSAIVTGAIIGVFLSFQLNAMGDIMSTSQMHGEMMTVEALRQSTTLVLRVYNTIDALSVATGFTMSCTNATYLETYRMAYTALPYTESLTEYLMLRAIDSPQHYVYMYAYGMEVKDERSLLEIQVLYSPIHHDTAAATRSMARTYMSLLRHYTGKLDADIEVFDDPLVLDSSPAQKKITVPPLIIHFMLIITIAHITLLPTMEHGLVRHMQLHAMNFSPARYWFSLFCCDILLYWTLVFIITTVLFCVMYWVAPVHFLHKDLIVIPFMLIMYGLSCVPQAYLFSLGPSAALNSMSFVIFNIIFGEASVISQFIHGDAFNYAERALSLSPQYNVANAFLRVTRIFVYNSECVIFNNKKLCHSNILNKCCKKCGIMQACFERISYLSKAGILDEILWTVYHSMIFSSLLIIWEYKIVQRLWYSLRNQWFAPVDGPLLLMDQPGSRQARQNVAMKTKNMKEKNKRDAFGGYLLVDNLTARGGTGAPKFSRLSFGIGKGEALAVVGLSDSGGRLRLCEILAGYKMPTSGRVTTMSRWSLAADPHKYSRNVAFSCFEHSPLPPWMTVYDAMWMIAVLRGVPRLYVKEEITNLLDALDLGDLAQVNVFRLHQNEQTRLNFAVAVIGAPPVLILDEFTAYQHHSVSRAMFYILYHLRKQGNALFVSSASVENHMAVTNRVGILLNGQLVDVDHVDHMVARYSPRGYTVVVHLKEEVDVAVMFAEHFKRFSINDENNVLANVQVEDALNYAQIFAKMEQLLQVNDTVYSYIISVTAMDYIYNDFIDKVSKVPLAPEEYQFWPCLKFLGRKKKQASIETLRQLEKFEKKYDIASLKELPWSVIFRR